MITILGVGHVFDIQERVKSEIAARNPAVVAVELDRGRYESLKSGEKGKGAPLIYRAMSLIQKRIAKKFEVKVGSEMLAAVDIAEKIGANVALIDMPSQIVFKKMLGQMSIKEKVYFFFGTVAGLFAGKKKIEKEMDRYEKHSGDYMKVVEKEMPALSRVLIDDRNVHMAKNIKRLEERFGSVVAVVGDGHVPGLVKEIRGRRESGDDIEILRLKDIRKKKESKDNSEISFSFSYEA
ncbi:MAG: TraB/GumN family protein [Thermoplasmatota archaeon]